MLSVILSPVPASKLVEPRPSARMPPTMLIVPVLASKLKHANPAHEPDVVYFVKPEPRLTCMRSMAILLPTMSEPAVLIVPEGVLDDPWKSIMIAPNIAGDMARPAD